MASPIFVSQDGTLPYSVNGQSSSDDWLGIDSSSTTSPSSPKPERMCRQNHAGVSTGRKHGFSIWARTGRNPGTVDLYRHDMLLRLEKGFIATAALSYNSIHCCSNRWHVPTAGYPGKQYLVECIQQRRTSSPSLDCTPPGARGQVFDHYHSRRSFSFYSRSFFLPRYFGSSGPRDLPSTDHGCRNDSCPMPSQLHEGTPEPSHRHRFDTLDTLWYIGWSINHV